MKITGLNSEWTDSVLLAFDDFKKHMDSKDRKSFSYENFMGFINTNDYNIIGYKWHEDESELEQDNYGKKAISIYNVLLAFSGSSKKYILRDDQNQIITIVKKIDKNKYEFI